MSKIKRVRQAEWCMLKVLNKAEIGRKVPRQKALRLDLYISLHGRTF